jgi:hypothetical protein
MNRFQRYKVEGEWSTTAEIHHGAHTIVIECADARDTKNNDIFPEGYYRVRSTGARIEGFRGKSFVGETAWSDAQRYARDWDFKIRWAS